MEMRDDYRIEWTEVPMDPVPEMLYEEDYRATLLHQEESANGDLVWREIDRATVRILVSLTKRERRAEQADRERNLFPDAFWPSPMAERVRRGVHHMDHYYPGWADRVGAESLDMSWRGRDILDQGGLHPFEPGVEQPALYYSQLETHGPQHMIEMGFEIAPGETWEDLTAMWADWIILRQEMARKRRVHN